MQHFSISNCTTASSGWAQAVEEEAAVSISFRERLVGFMSLVVGSWKWEVVKVEEEAQGMVEKPFTWSHQMMGTERVWHKELEWWSSSSRSSNSKRVWSLLSCLLKKQRSHIYPFVFFFSLCLCPKKVNSFVVVYHVNLLALKLSRNLSMLFLKKESWVESFCFKVSEAFKWFQKAFKIYSNKKTFSQWM